MKLSRLIIRAISPQLGSSFVPARQSAARLRNSCGAWGTYLLLAIVFVLSASALVSSVWATSIYIPSNAQEDMGLSYIFSVLGIGSGSDVAPQLATMREAMRNMLRLFSNALLVIGSFILVYHIVIIVAETAHHGQAFGKRHNAVWAPLRVLLAITMLVPLASGMNLGQHIVVKLAEMGSGLATNGWGLFVQSLSRQENLLINPEDPVVSPILQTYLLQHVCLHAINQALMENVYDQESDRSAIADNATIGAKQNIMAVERIVYHPSDFEAGIIDYIPPPASLIVREVAEAPAKWENQALSYEEKFRTVWEYSGQAICGEVHVDVPVVGKDFSDVASISHIQALQSIQPQINEMAEGIVRQISLSPNTPLIYSGSKLKSVLVNYHKELRTMHNQYYDMRRGELARSMQALNQDEKGWVSAPLFFTLIATMNNRVSGITDNLPQMISPSVAAEMQDNSLPLAPTLVDSWKRAKGATQAWFSKSYRNLEQIRVDRTVFTDNRPPPQINFEAERRSIMSLQSRKQEDGSMRQAFNEFFKSYTPDQKLWDHVTGTNPITGSIALGSRIVGQTFSSFDVAFSALGSGAAAGMGAIVGPFMSVLALIGLFAGVLLAFMVPLLPFIRFIGGLLAWLMHLFEAVIAVPIWVLGHLTTEGDGITGNMGKQGYFLILQLFLRPILMIFGLIGGLLLLSVITLAINSMFGTVLHDSSASGDGTPFPSFVMLMIYAVIVYISANNCFKLIDILPGEILRWIGSPGVKAATSSTTAPNAGAQVMGGVSGGGPAAGPALSGGVNAPQIGPGGGGSGGAAIAQTGALRGGASESSGPVKRIGGPTAGGASDSFAQSRQFSQSNAPSGGGMYGSQSRGPGMGRSGGTLRDQNDRSSDPLTRKMKGSGHSKSYKENRHMSGNERISEKYKGGRNHKSNQRTSNHETFKKDDTQE